MIVLYTSILHYIQEPALQLCTAKQEEDDSGASSSVDDSGAKAAPEIYFKCIDKSYLALIVPTKLNHKPHHKLYHKLYHTFFCSPDALAVALGK